MGTLLIHWDLKPSSGIKLSRDVCGHAAKLSWMALEAVTRPPSCQAGAVQQHTHVDGSSQLLSQCTAHSQIIKIEAALSGQHSAQNTVTETSSVTHYINRILIKVVKPPWYVSGRMHYHCCKF